MEYLHERRGANLTIVGDPEPDLFADLDGERVGRARPTELMKRSAEITFEEQMINWPIVAFPTEGWAAKVVGTPDVDRLWNLVVTAVRLDEPDPVASWTAHVASVLPPRRRPRRGTRVALRGRPHRRCAGAPWRRDRRAQLATDAGAPRLGEVALVDRFFPRRPTPGRVLRHAVRPERTSRGSTPTS
jgi:leucyl aminopeptidase (aminopeptidase T)